MLLVAITPPTDLPGPVPSPLSASTPLAPSPDEGRELLERELADPTYQREFTGPVRQAIEDFLAWLSDRMGSIGGVDIPYGPLIIMVLLIAAIVLIILLVRPRLQRTGGADEALTIEPGISSDELRARAEEHRRAGRADECFRDLYRAVVRAAEEREILTELMGRTATEAARELTAVFPSHGPRIGTAAELFNLSRYGGRSLTAQDCEDLSGLDATLAAAEPQTSQSPAAPQVVAPR